MIINPYNFGVAIDPDAQAFITAASITDTTQKNAVNTLVIDLKGYGLWNKMYAIYPFVGGTANSHKYNLKNPVDSNAAYRLTFNGGWVHSNNGILGNGVNTYANTNLGMNILPQNNAHLSTYSRTNSIGNRVELGVYYTTIAFYSLLCARLSNNFQTRLNSGASDALIANTDSTGFYQVYRTDATNILNKKNTATPTSFARASVSNGGFTFPYFLGDLNFNSTPLGYYTNREYTFASLGEGYTDTDAANLYTIIQTFQTTLGRSIGTQTVSDPDAQAFINAAVIEDQVQATAVNTLVTNLKGYGLWNKMKAIYPFVGGTASSHKWNLKDPRDLDVAFRLVFNGGFTHSSNGIIGNGTNGYVDTKFNPVSQSSVQNNFSISIYSRTNLAAAQFDIGNSDFWAAGTKGTNIVTLYSNANRYINIANNNYLTLNADTNSLGFYCGATNGSSTQILYKNGSNVLSGTSAQSGFSNSNLYISAVNELNIAQQYSSKQYAFGSIGEGLSATEAANLYTAVQAFQTTLGRQV